MRMRSKPLHPGRPRADPCRGEAGSGRADLRAREPRRRCHTRRGAHLRRPADQRQSHRRGSGQEGHGPGRPLRDHDAQPSRVRRSPDRRVHHRLRLHSHRPPDAGREAGVPAAQLGQSRRRLRGLHRRPAPGRTRADAGPRVAAGRRIGRGRRRAHFGCEQCGVARSEVLAMPVPTVDTRVEDVSHPASDHLHVGNHRGSQGHRRRPHALRRNRHAGGDLRLSGGRTSLHRSLLLAQQRPGHRPRPSADEPAIAPSSVVASPSRSSGISVADTRAPASRSSVAWPRRSTASRPVRTIATTRFAWS